MVVRSEILSTAFFQIPFFVLPIYPSCHPIKEDKIQKFRPNLSGFTTASLPRPVSFADVQGGTTALAALSHRSPVSSHRAAGARAMSTIYILIELPSRIPLQVPSFCPTFPGLIRPCRLYLGWLDLIGVMMVSLRPLGINDEVVLL